MVKASDLKSDGVLPSRVRILPSACISFFICEISSFPCVEEGGYHKWYLSTLEINKFATQFF